MYVYYYVCALTQNWAWMQAMMSSAVKQGQGQGQVPGVNRSLRQHIVEEQGGYCLDAARVEEQLRLGESSPSLL